MLQVTVLMHRVKEGLYVGIILKKYVFFYFVFILSMT